MKRKLSNQKKGKTKQTKRGLNLREGEYVGFFIPRMKKGK